MKAEYKEAWNFSLFSSTEGLREKIPSCCELCKTFDFHQIPNLCDRCAESLPYLRYSCKRCALPLQKNLEHCGNCITFKPAFDSASASFIFQEPVNTLINLYKNHQHQALTSTLAALFCKQMLHQKLDGPKADILIPIPLHWRRQLVRGFNQSHELCKQISEQMDIPLGSRTLKRIAHRTRQTGLNRQQRLRNIRKTFVVSGDVSNQNIILFDDVVTTGATVEAASRALKKAGAKHITVWSLARTAKKG